MFGILEKIGRTASQIFRKTPMATRPSRPSERRVKSGGSWTDAQGRNIPDPWSRREWDKTRDIANLPAAIDGGISGPTKTMYGERLIQINPDAFRRPRPFRSESEYRAQFSDMNEQGSAIAMDPRSRGIASSHPRRQYHSREERLSRAGPSEVHSVALDSTRKHPRGSTDVLSKYPQSRDETPPLPPIRFGSAVYQGERVTLAEFVRRRIRSVI